MNRVDLVGRLTKDPEGGTYGNDGKSVVRFSIAVSRRYKNSDGKYDADFPNCVAFDKTAEFIINNFRKGKPIGICGHIQTGSYTNKDGVKVYTTDVIVDNAEFVENKSQGDASNNGSNNRSYTTDSDGFMNVPESGYDDDLPFN